MLDCMQVCVWEGNWRGGGAYSLSTDIAESPQTKMVSTELALHSLDPLLVIQNYVAFSRPSTSNTELCL